MKDALYLFAARYFALWARLVLWRWQPRIVVVTGSSGKTTLLNMIGAQVDETVKLSHHANSAFGIPFNILQLEAIETGWIKWLTHVVRAPYQALAVKHSEAIYVAEVDAERPGEAPLLGHLLKPEVTLWVSSSRTHSRFYDQAVADGHFDSVEAAIVHEYGQVASITEKLVLFDGANEQMSEFAKTLAVRAEPVSAEHDLADYKVDSRGTAFSLKNGSKYYFSDLLPRAVATQVMMLDELLRYLHLEPDYGMARFHQPPGRSSLFKGKHGVTIIDSTYNANLDSMRAILELFGDFPAEHKWAVIGEMMEQGEGSRAEHQKLAEHLAKLKLEKIILYGEMVQNATAPRLQKLCPTLDILTLAEPVPILEYLQKHLKGNETVLFKGGRALEGVIAPLLAHPADSDRLARRGSYWDLKRAEKGL